MCKLQNKQSDNKQANKQAKASEMTRLKVALKFAPECSFFLKSSVRTDDLQIEDLF